MRSKVIIFSCLLSVMAVSFSWAVPPGGVCFCDSYVEQTATYFGNGSNCSQATQDAKNQALAEANSICWDGPCYQALVIDTPCGFFHHYYYVDAHLNFRCWLCE